MKAIYLTFSESPISVFKTIYFTVNNYPSSFVAGGLFKGAFPTLLIYYFIIDSVFLRGTLILAFSLADSTIPFYDALRYFLTSGGDC
jgi:hypothetical protein